ncbi:TIR domain-containing protein [Erwinia sp. S59]|uniref:TIR domain-containing protein n=1 Tax=Erwiniaceae TaxID=1903409 RepID=UPI0019091C8E|nr:nucleotide-binding protein [Erwinia sp. S59]MBK0089459.1 nucleotide-binding protein [Erwinia sp. S59]
MDKSVYAGFWTGEIKGTNQGGVSFTLTVDGNVISGNARISEPYLGQYEYLIEGSADNGLSLNLIPGRKDAHINLGRVRVICNLNAEKKLVGRWESEIGTSGVFIAEKFDETEMKEELPHKNSVFLVHGHDEGTKHNVARFLEKLGVEPVILQEQINKGMTIIEKFQEFAKRAGFAVVLMTPDDHGYPVSKEELKRHRARQNVILELGYFTALLGREKTMVLVKGDIELPSDVIGVTYERIDEGEGWKMRLARELKAAGFEVSLDAAL